MHDVDCVVIGAGVVGLAVARALAIRGREVLILEKERHFGTHTSSRNSEVIHAGIYYEPESLKARACVEGRELLYQYCRDHQIEHRRCGKFIVATDKAHIEALHTISKTARQNGVEDLQWFDGAETRRHEPQLSCIVSLFSPSTGIIDSHGYMLSLLGDAEANGTYIVYGVALEGAAPSSKGLVLRMVGDSQPSLRCRTLVNSGGLDAVRIAASIEEFPREWIPRLFLAKGSYFTLSGAPPFSHLIYPIPDAGGLGIHSTIDLAGQARFGPDVEWTEDLDYQVDPTRADRFHAAIRRYWPAFDSRRLHAAYSGIRPKLSGPGEPNSDFRISGPKEHGFDGVVNLYGIESPGLTASLALAERVSDEAMAT
jgi:L-2-hydroxyglutarate oxidase LhgO